MCLSVMELHTLYISYVSNQICKACPHSPCLSVESAKSSASVVVKTVPAATPPPPVVMMSSMKVPPIKPALSKSTTVTLIPPSSAPAPSVEKSASPVTSKATVGVDASCPAVNPPVSKALSEQAPVQTTAPTKAKTSLSISVSKPQNKLTPPPVVPPKPQSPVNVHSINNKPSSPGPPPAPVIGKPISSVPMYKPTAIARAVLPSQSSSAPTTTAPSVTHVALSPPVVVVQSLTPVPQGGDSRSTPSGRVTPSGRATPSGRRTPLGKPGEGSLRQGVPQKPYTFMDEKAR